MTFGLSAGAMALIGGAATLGGAAISANASKKAGKQQADAAGQAADAQLEASREATASQERMMDRQLGLQREQFDRSIGLMQPGIQRGNTAANRMMQLLGLDVPQAMANGETEQQVRERLTPQYRTMFENGGGYNEDRMGLDAAIQREMQGSPGNMAPRSADFGSLNRRFGRADFEADPGYQFRLEEGEKAINRGAAARGMFDSGRSMKDLLRFGQGLASDEYSRSRERFEGDQSTSYNRLANLAGVGQTASTTAAGAGQNYASQAGQAMSNFGAQQGQNILAGGNARASAYQTGGDARAAGGVGSANAWNQAIGQGINMYQGNRMMDLLRRPQPTGIGGTQAGYRYTVPTYENPEY